jgi:hypothetical protein
VSPLSRPGARSPPVEQPPLPRARTLQFPPAAQGPTSADPPLSPAGR